MKQSESIKVKGIFVSFAAKTYAIRLRSIIFHFLLTFGILSASQNNRIEYNGKLIFLSGANAAWINYAKDIGNPDAPFDKASFTRMFKVVSDNGGNSLRFWIHINGASTPEFKGHSVVGPGVRALEDLKSLCDLAYEYKVGLILCLWSFDMQRIKEWPIPDEHLARNKYILTTDKGLDSYLQKALIPMVVSLKEHPGIIAWEIFNEPEGMTEIGDWDVTQHVTQHDVQKFTNRCAGAIRRADPSCKITNGAWSLIAGSDQDGNTNYYTDERLIAAGGDELGILDFYSVHYYDWDKNSPFLKPYSHWKWDKPTVIAEFHPHCNNCGEGSNFDNLYKNGYAGALAWSYTDHEKGHMKAMLKEMKLMSEKYKTNINPVR
jgi:hypothetical protein